MPVKKIQKILNRDSHHHEDPEMPEIKSLCLVWLPKMAAVGGVGPGWPSDEASVRLSQMFMKLQCVTFSYVGVTYAMCL